jgi:hypothetical protein
MVSRITGSFEKNTSGIQLKMFSERKAVMGNMSIFTKKAHTKVKTNNPINFFRGRGSK